MYYLLYNNIEEGPPNCWEKKGKWMKMPSKSHQSMPSKSNYNKEAFVQEQVEDGIFLLKRLLCWSAFQTQKHLICQ